MAGEEIGGRASPDPYAGRAATDHERRFGPWDESYRRGEPPPWDIGRPQPAIATLVEDGGFRGSVLDAGCGTGEHALLLASRGHEVLGLDVAASAIDEARRKALARDLPAAFAVADALQLEGLGRTFDSVLDVGLFHTFGDEERESYVAGLASVTDAGALLHLLCFSDQGTWDDGPRRISRAELRSAFQRGWNIRRIAAAGIQTTLSADAIPAWLASIERS